MATTIVIHTKRRGIEKDEVFERVTPHFYVDNLHAPYSKHVALVETGQDPVVIGSIDGRVGGGFKRYKEYTKEEEELMRGELPLFGGVTANVLQQSYPGELEALHATIGVST